MTDNDIYYDTLFLRLLFLFLCMGTIGHTLTQLRFRSGLTQSTVAKAIKVSAGNLSQFERDKREVSYITMFRICRFYEISLHEFADMLTAKELERSDYSIIRMQEKKQAKALLLKKQA